MSVMQYHSDTNKRAVLPSVCLLTAVIIGAAILVAGQTAYGAEGDPVNQGQFKYSMEITPSGYSGSALTDFPALIVLKPSLTGFSYSQFKLPGGGDLRFADDANAELAYEIEEWNTNGNSYIWVKVPSFSSATTIKALWGNDRVSTPSYVTGAVWNPDFVGVLHMTEPNAHDETAYTNNPMNSTYGEAISSEDTPGIVGTCQRFDGNDHLRMDSLADDIPDDEFLVTALVKTTSPRGANTSLGHTVLAITKEVYPASVAFRLAVGMDGVDGGEPCTVEGYDPANITGESNTTVDDGNWHQVAYSLSAGIGALYVDGEKIATPAAGYTLPPAEVPPTYVFPYAASWIVGATYNDLYSLSAYAIAHIDEVRISRTARSDDWLAAAWGTIGDHANFMTYAEVEVAAELGSVFFGW